MRRATLLAAFVAASLTQFPASAAPDKTPPATKIVFFGPTDGPLAATAEESFVGVRSAFAGTDIDLSRDAPKKPRAYDAWFADIEKRGVALTLAYLPDGEAPLVEKAAEKAKVPLLVLSPEETRPDLEANRAVFWAGGLSPIDEALFAMDFLLTPLSVHAPAVFHDGSPRAVLAAAKCAHFHHTSQTPRAPAALPADFGVADVKGLLGRHASAAAAAAADATTAGESADGIVYFGGPAGAERLLAACADAKIEAPVLLGQGLASRAVPSFADGRAASAWALDSAYFEDYCEGKGSPASADAPYLAEVSKDTGGHLYAATVRGRRAGRWIVEALHRAPESPEKKPERKFVWALRTIAREGARGKPVFEPWGHASLARFEAWRGAKWRDDPPCTRVKPTYMPMSGIPQIGFFTPDSVKWEPGSYYVWLHWGKPEERTIERDLKAVGLDPGDYEFGFRAQITDDLMGRTISRLNRLFLRNPDGTGVPGVSFNVTFGTEEHPAGLKNGHRFEMILRGDNPDAGGMAHGTTCEVFTTMIQRTMYASRALKPELSAADHAYVNGTYKWGAALDTNLRGELIRALADGYTQAFGLTGAHECGHMFGLGHDTTTPRSIMNVAEAVGLDFEWAEWSPDHVTLLEKRLGRTPVPK